MKEQVSVDNMWREGEDINYLQNHIDKNWNNLADNALENLVKKYNRLKRMEENVKQKINEAKQSIEWAKNRGIKALSINNVILELLESLDK